ncbi:hypothetical protein RG963_16030 [Methanosarcina sp. Z-7115]|uniref:Mobile element protein n=1 Tax=Methanosarcina baikalica TaxID=3073890 RepID=A0ABU2D5M3_9EURY|nr:hypothetical protein [Methanosarcina sp. Z-7115]MDR7667255.1 hypothetical protein [Methanosarcina sp. Z-7115]
MLEMNFKNNYINSFIAKAIEVIEKLENRFTSCFTLEYSWRNSQACIETYDMGQLTNKQLIL